MAPIRFAPLLVAIFGTVLVSAMAVSSDSFDATAMLTDREGSKCDCTCIAVADFKESSCSGSSCGAYDCKTADNADGKTCCNISDTIDLSRAVEHSNADEKDIKSPGTEESEPSVKDAVKLGEKGEEGVSAVARPWRRRCYYRVRVKCYCRYYRRGSRWYRQCRCYRIRYRYCKWYYSRS